MMHRVPRLWPGSTIAVLATGPSLTQADCDLLRGRVPVIAINDAHRLAPWADVLYSSDRLWWPYYKGVPSFQGLKYGIGSSIGKHNSFPNGLPVTVLLNSGYDGIDPEPTSLRNGRNSGHAAINLAVHFGASRLILLGYHMGVTHHPAHFFGNHPSGLAQNTSLYVSWRKTLATTVEPLRQLGVEVLNCTPGTSITCFPTADLRQVLAARVAA